MTKTRSQTMRLRWLDPALRQRYLAGAAKGRDAMKNSRYKSRKPKQTGIPLYMIEERFK